MAQAMRTTCRLTASLSIIRRPRAALQLALLATVVILYPQTAASAPSQADIVDNPDDNMIIARAGLEIDTTAAGNAGPVMLSRLEELGNLELRRAEILPRRAVDDPVIHLRLEVRGDEGDTYAIFSELTVRGALLAGSAHEILCSLCTEGEAVERARSELLRLVPFIRARFRPRPSPQLQPAPLPPPPTPRLGLRGKAGVGLLAGGALAFGTGLGLALTPPRPDPDDPLRAIDLRPAGYAVLTIGAAAIVGGAVLLILDRRAPHRLTRLEPTLSPNSAGLLLLGRF